MKFNLPPKVGLKARVANLKNADEEAETDGTELSENFKSRRAEIAAGKTEDSWASRTTPNPDTIRSIGGF